MSNIVFSIVIPTYNGGKTLGELLSKLYSLRDNYNKEIIIIDSGSQDSTINIINKFKNQHKNLRFCQIKKEEFNHGKTRNLGVKLSKGKYVCFFSQDAIPRTTTIFTRYYHDFQIDHKVVAIFGKHIPYANTPEYQKIEIICRWDLLDEYTDKSGLLIQGVHKPFIEYTEASKYLWYALSNTSSAYKRKFLIENPFPHVTYGEDMFMGKKIIELGLIKIYDKKCAVTHSHSFSYFEYYFREREDLKLRLNDVRVKTPINIIRKISLIFSKRDFLYILVNLSRLVLYYVIKFIILLSFFYESITRRTQTKCR